MKKRLTAALCALIFVVTLVGATLATGVICFTAVNDNLLPLTSDTMPAWSGNSLYVPYTVFDRNSSGGNLGTYVTYSRSNGTVTVYNSREMLIFDLNAGNSYNNNTQEVYSAKAIYLNGRVYLPVSMVCSVFGLKYSYTVTNYGMLLRIKGEHAVLSDASFIDAADSQMSSRLREYNQSLQPTPPVIDPPPSVVDPTAPPTITDPGDLPSGSGAVYLAVQVESVVATEQILTALEARGSTALFLFTPEQISGLDDLVRQVLGRGHRVGLLVWEDTLEQTRVQLEQGSQRLAAVAHTQTNIVFCPAEQRQKLNQEGWVCWQETTSAVSGGDLHSYDYAAAAVASLPTGRGPVYLTLEGSDSVGKNADALLRSLNQRQLVLTTPVESQL